MSDHCIPLNKEADGCKRFGFLNLRVAKAKSRKRKPQDSLLCRRAAERALLSKSPPVSLKRLNPLSLLLLSAQVKSEYAKLKETLGAVTQERDLALWERNQLQDKLENLEQVLKVRKRTQRAAMTLVSLKNSVCILFVVVCLFSDPDSGVFFGEN